MTPRSYLFVPGNRPERFAKALASGADGVVLDLEDAVAADAKPAARDAIANWAAGADAPDAARVMVRINEAGSPEFAEDLRLLADSGLGSVMLSKAESREQLAAVRSRLPAASIVALLESARGLARAESLAGAPGVIRLAFGTLDFALDLDIELAHHSAGLSFAAGLLSFASRLADLPPPIAGVTPQLADNDRLLADLAWERAQGFTAKLCIHPQQVAAIHQALAPDAAALDWARSVLAADAQSPGAAQLDGRMVDRPVVLQAQRLLARAFR